MKLLVGIISCVKHNARREGCRRSWLASVRRDQHVEAIFVVADPRLREARLEGDTLYAPCLDDYPHLPQKTRCLVEWALAARVDKLFKCDDDTFVCGDRLIELAAQSPDFTGHEMAPGETSGGAGYLLSAKAMSALAECMGNVDVGAEDVIVSRLLRERGIPLKPNRRFWPWNNAVPTLYNDQVTAHYIGPEAMRGLAGSLASERSALYRLVDGSAKYGSVGVHGFRGFVANGTADVELPVAGIDDDDELISAHASSQVTIDVLRPVAVCGFLDRGAINADGAVEFVIDESMRRRLKNAGERTEWSRLQPGRHVLRATTPGPNGRCYSVWCVRET